MSKSIKPELKLQLKSKAEDDQERGIKCKFDENSQRAEDYFFDQGEFKIDFSKTHIDETLKQLYLKLADDCGFQEMRHSLFTGEKINTSENRAVLHTLLRNPENFDLPMHGEDLRDQARDSVQQFESQLAQIESQLASRKKPVKNIIHVGIGGSALGPQLVYEALKPLSNAINIHFVGNIDAHNLVAVLAKCDPDDTLVIGVSKTFTTAETLKNLDSILDWFKQAGSANPLDNLYAVTANPEQAAVYGIPSENTVSFPTWVGGRYSVWSSVSLSVAIVLGLPAFREFLEGAKTMDAHFLNTPLSDNTPFIAACLDHYYSNYLHAGSRAIFAYDYRLRSLVDYLQQLETESNGKDRQRDGTEVDQKTSAVIWGGVGTDVQHSVFQMLHQGTSLIPAEFILVKQADHDLKDHHQSLLANGIAQTAALLAGQSESEVRELHASENLSELAIAAKQFSGERPSTTFILERLTPKCLGALLAFYEHRTFTFGVLCNINSYDQMGVELGKRLAKTIQPLIENPALIDAQPQQKKADGLDPSTLNLLRSLT